MTLRVVVTGLIAQHPRLGGMTWHYLQYVKGLQAMGHDVYYIEDSGEWPYNWDGGARGDDWVERDPTANIAHLRWVMAGCGMDDRWSYRFPLEDRWFGMSGRRRREIIASADLLLNVSGSLLDPSRYRGAGRMAYIDSDPVFTQLPLVVEPDGELAKQVRAHDVHFSFGQRLDRVPPTPFAWQPTRQPIVLEDWEGAGPPGPAYTTVMSWTSYAPIVHDGTVYGQKDREMARFLDLPRRVPDVQLEIALPDQEHAEWTSPPPPGTPVPVSEATAEGPSGGKVAGLLSRAGWRPVDALERCGGVDRYREYVQGSRGEWTVAKSGYVEGRSGWFSERSACYLAAGRPVVTQDTGYDGVLPTGEGLLAFSTMDEAVGALEDVEARYHSHAGAALDMAHEYFDATRVLEALLDAATGTARPAHGAGCAPAQSCS
ncbi:MAG: hypothetical protein M3378_12885 [Actinomycetota bacterium]|nr:hypothetical protein [Actinomycetota bacterium]